MNARPPLDGMPWLRAVPLMLATAALVLGVTAADAAPANPQPIGADHTLYAVGKVGAASCNVWKSSIRPPGPPQVISSSYVTEIRHQGFLVAGVDQNTKRFGFLNPSDGQIEGFDIDMIRAVAKAIFGNSYTPDKVHLKAISDDERTPAIQNGSVDIVAHTMTITCTRLKQVDFSSVYFDAHQRVLVLKNSPAHSLTDLRGQKVCATKGATASFPAIVAAKAILDLVPYWTDCLVLLQQGDVSAISTDDSILQGLKDQDPWTKLLPGPPLNDQPYGLAISNKHQDFVAFVNAVLEQLITDGQWSEMYARWMGTPVPLPPKQEYRN